MYDLEGKVAVITFVGRRHGIRRERLDAWGTMGWVSICRP